MKRDVKRRLTQVVFLVVQIRFFRQVVVVRLTAKVRFDLHPADAEVFQQFLQGYRPLRNRVVQRWPVTLVQHDRDVSVSCVLQTDLVQLKHLVNFSEAVLIERRCSKRTRHRLVNVTLLPWVATHSPQLDDRF